MLQNLRIKNYALIEHLDINFQFGLSIITGETGAGKSILLGAIGMLLGQRGDISALKDPEQPCIIEGEFLVKSDSVKRFFEENNLDVANKILIRRQFFPNGKSKATINNSTVSLTILKALAEHLVDIHSQHQNLLLGKDSFQLNVIDNLADNGSLKLEYRQIYQEYKKKERELLALKDKAGLSKSELDYLQFQYNELQAANLKKGEQEKLEEELEQLTHAEELKTKFGHLSQLLSEEEYSVINSMGQINSILQKISSLFGKAEELSERAKSCLIELKDLGGEIENLVETTQVNPLRLSEVTERLDLIFTLQRKHKTDSVAGLLKIYDELAETLTVIDDTDERLKKMEREYEAIQVQLSEIANRLSLIRQQHFLPVEEHIVAMLTDLGMPNAQFRILHQPLESFSPTGRDSILFLFSANKGSLLQEISKVASGGEMARLMLTLKSLIASSGTFPTIIFDEIDTGISGEIANKMGDIIAQLGETLQVFNITHLPQVASKGQNHYVVYKQENKNNTTTHIKQLSSEERISEIAKMLSGSHVSDVAIENAKVLLKN